jgi:hypothetical protein
MTNTNVQGQWRSTNQFFSRDYAMELFFAKQEQRVEKYAEHEA